MSRTFSIKEVAEKFALPISTIHFYDKKGLLPFVSKNKSGHRAFTPSDLSLIHTICCLKNTGMPIGDIRKYIELCLLGPDTIEQRKTLMKAHKCKIMAQQEELLKDLQEIDKKIERYDDPNARKIITAEINHIIEEKKRENLESAFKKR